jgi:hypothetical protein
MANVRQPKHFHENFTYEQRAAGSNAPLSAEESLALVDSLKRIDNADTFKEALNALAGTSKAVFVPHTTPIQWMNGLPMLSVPIICVTAMNSEMDTTLSAGQYVQLEVGGAWLAVRVEQTVASLLDSSSYFTGRVVSALLDCNVHSWSAFNVHCAAGSRRRHPVLPVPSASSGAGAH